MSKAIREITKKPPAKRAFHSIVGSIGEFQADICFPKYHESAIYRKANHGNSCILMVMEVCTRYAYARPLKSKAEVHVVEAFREIHDEICNDIYRLTRLTTDAGKEFDSKRWNAMMREFEIQQFTNEPGTHWALGAIDSFTRTLKRRIEDHQLKRKTLNWDNALAAIIKKYNQTVKVITNKAPDGKRARGMKASPVELRKYGGAFERAMNIDNSRGEHGRINMNKFAVGNHVRIRLRPMDQPRDKSRKGEPGNVAKGCDRWSHKTYTITSKDRYSFALVDTAGRKPKRDYRAHELLKIDADSVDEPDIFERVAKQARKVRLMRRENLD